MSVQPLDERQENFRVRLLKAYEVYKTARGAARALGISHPTATKYLRQYGVDVLKPGGYYARVRPGRQKRTSKFHQWLQANEGVVLPRSPKAQAELSGCTEDTIRSYWKRERKLFRGSIRNLPDLRTKSVPLEDTDGEVYLSIEMRQYKLLADVTAFILYIDATLRNGKKVMFKVPDVEKLKNVYEEKSP
jgi:hypothetical protein